jgi:integrase
MVSPDDIAGAIADVAKRRSLLTAHRAYTVLHKMFNDAKRWGDAAANPVAEVDAPADAHALRKKHPFGSVDELCVLVAAIPPPWRPIVFVDLLTGLRWGEVTAWRWADLRLEVGKASVWQNIPVGERVPGIAKGRSAACGGLVPRSRRRPHGSSAAR